MYCGSRVLGPSNPMLDCGSTTPQDYPEWSGFGRRTEEPMLRRLADGARGSGKIDAASRRKPGATVRPRHSMPHSAHRCTKARHVRSGMQVRVATIVSKRRGAGVRTPPAPGTDRDRKCAVIAKSPAR